MRWLQARASADIVLTEPGLSTIVDAIVIARRIFRRISNFLNYRIAATLQLLLFFFIAVFAFAPYDYNPRVSHAGCLCCVRTCAWTDSMIKLQVIRSIEQAVNLGVLAGMRRCTLDAQLCCVGCFADPTQCLCLILNLCGCLLGDSGPASSSFQC